MSHTPTLVPCEDMIYDRSPADDDCRVIARVYLGGRELTKKMAVACNNHDRLVRENKELREALESISKNTCCDKCQETALVARAALAKVTP